MIVFLAFAVHSSPGPRWLPVDASAAIGWTSCLSTDRNRRPDWWTEQHHWRCFTAEWAPLAHWSPVSFFSEQAKRALKWKYLFKSWKKGRGPIELKKTNLIFIISNANTTLARLCKFDFKRFKNNRWNNVKNYELFYYVNIKLSTQFASVRVKLENQLVWEKPFWN